MITFAFDSTFDACRFVRRIRQSGITTANPEPSGLAVLVAVSTDCNPWSVPVGDIAVAFGGREVTK